MTTSWDCFDTLVTRRKLDPLTVFDDMGVKLGLNNFTHRRKSAESRAPWTLDSIYEELGKDYGWDKSTESWYKNLEIEAEIEHCCPIVENIQKVKDGDLIVSDMYLPEWAVERIIRNCGMNKSVKVHVTTGGKSSGTIWSSLPPIELHVGDNFHSDVASPSAHGITGLHYTNVFPTGLEQSVGGDLGLLMRVVRLANPYEEGSLLHAMWIEQSQFNIPALILVALEAPRDNVAFVHRDCVHLQPIHAAIHGTTNASFHCSRIALAEGGEQWKDYVKASALGKTIVDLHGSGKSICDYWKNTFNRMPDLLYVTGTLQNGQLLFQCSQDAIERFNSSPLGSLAKYPSRKTCEFDAEVIQCQKAAVDCALSHLRYFCFSPSRPTLEKLISLMAGSVTDRMNKHVVDHCTAN